jgi:hypothetical protein
MSEDHTPDWAALIDGKIVVGTKPYTRWQRIKRRWWKLPTTRYPSVTDGPCGEDGGCAVMPGCRCPFDRYPSVTDEP